MQTAYQNDTETKYGAQIAVSHIVSSAEGTANSAAITVGDLDTVKDVIAPTIRKADGTYNTAGLDVSFATNVVTVAATALTAGEVITFFAVETK